MHAAAAAVVQGTAAAAEHQHAVCDAAVFHRHAGLALPQHRQERPARLQRRSRYLTYLAYTSLLFVDYQYPSATSKTLLPTERIVASLEEGKALQRILSQKFVKTNVSEHTK